MRRGAPLQVAVGVFAVLFTPVTCMLVTVTWSDQRT
jgi:hypothetical protein